MLKRTVLSLAAVVATGLIALPAHAAEVTLKGASCFPIGSPVSKPFEALVKQVNEAGKGVVQIDLIGGAPAIGSPFEMTKRMTKGVYDIVGCPDAYWANVVPEAAALKLSDYTADELRRNGGFDYMRKLYEEKNIHFVARTVNFGPFFLWLNKTIDKADLSGLHLRVSPIYVPFFKALGATVQRSNIAQVYTYMENGTVQGYGWPALGWPPAWVKVTKYRVEPGFYGAYIQTIANLEKWRTLTKAQQDVIVKVAMSFEADAETWPDKLKKQNAMTAEQGLQAIVLQGAEREKYLRVAKQAGWAAVIEKSPEHGPKLQTLFTK